MSPRTKATTQLASAPEPAPKRAAQASGPANVYALMPAADIRRAIAELERTLDGMAFPGRPDDAERRRFYAAQLELAHAALQRKYA